MAVRYLPAVGSKHLEAISNAVLASGSALGGDFDVVHYHAVGPGTAATLPRVLSDKPVVLTVHGLDGEREKWGGLATRALRSASWMSARVPHETVVVSRALQAHYREHYGREAVYIPNGMPPSDKRPFRRCRALQRRATSVRAVRRPAGSGEGATRARPGLSPG